MVFDPDAYDEHVLGSDDYGEDKQELFGCGITLTVQECTWVIKEDFGGRSRTMLNVKFDSPSFNRVFEKDFSIGDPTDVIPSDDGSVVRVLKKAGAQWKMHPKTKGYQFLTSLEKAGFPMGEFYKNCRSLYGTALVLDTKEIQGRKGEKPIGYYVVKEILGDKPTVSGSASETVAQKLQKLILEILESEPVTKAKMRNLVKESGWSDDDMSEGLRLLNDPSFCKSEKWDFDGENFTSSLFKCE